MTPKLEYKPVSPQLPELKTLIFTDSEGHENMNDIAEKVTAAFQEMAAQLTVAYDAIGDWTTKCNEIETKLEAERDSLIKQIAELEGGLSKC